MKFLRNNADHYCTTGTNEMNRIIQSAACVLLAGALTIPTHASPEIPGTDQKAPIALVGGTLHPVSGPPIENGVLIFDGGLITAVGPRDQIEIPNGVRQIDVAGKHVYPGLFDAYTNIGLVEVNAVRATEDHTEAGQLNPNVTAIVAVNPDSELIPVTRSNGVLLAVTAPTGGMISGRSAVIQLDGWTYEDLTVKADVGLHVQWPRMTPVVSWSEEKSTDQQSRERDESLRKLQDFFDDARAYRQARDAGDGSQPFDARLAAMLPVLAGDIPLIAQADDLQEIQAAVAFASQQKVRLIILGGYDAPHCATLLKKHNVPVIVSAVYRLPQRRGDDYDAAYTLPERLRKAGVKFCISSSGRFGASNVRNLPYHAAMAAAFGLPPDDALRSITLSAAEILGVSDQVGSLESGKQATLFITTGDPLETTSLVEQAFIQGREVDLSDRHKRLWKKYEEKYRRLDQIE